jgi:hypothetical protein
MCGKKLTAATYGGAVRRRDISSENPIPFNMMVMKNPRAYAGIVEAINMSASLSGKLFNFKTSF